MDMPKLFIFAKYGNYTWHVDWDGCREHCTEPADSITGCLLMATDVIPDTEKMVNITCFGKEVGNFYQDEMEEMPEEMAEKIVLMLEKQP